MWGLTGKNFGLVTMDHDRHATHPTFVPPWTDITKMSEMGGGSQDSRSCLREVETQKQPELGLRSQHRDGCMNKPKTSLKSFTHISSSSCRRKLRQG